MPQKPPAFEALVMRIAALGTSVGTIAFLFIGDDWRLENIFLIPDLAVSLVLALGAALPRARAYPLLLAGFAMGSGVFATASAAYFVEGRVGIGAGIALATCLVAGAVGLRRLLRKPGR